MWTPEAVEALADRLIAQVKSSDKVVAAVDKQTSAIERQNATIERYIEKMDLSRQTNEHLATAFENFTFEVRSGFSGIKTELAGLKRGVDDSQQFQLTVLHEKEKPHWSIALVNAFGKMPPLRLILLLLMFATIAASGWIWKLSE